MGTRGRPLGRLTFYPVTAIPGHPRISCPAPAGKAVLPLPRSGRGAIPPAPAGRPCTGYKPYLVTIMLSLFMSPSRGITVRFRYALGILRSGFLVAFVVRCALRLQRWQRLHLAPERYLRQNE